MKLKEFKKALKKDWLCFEDLILAIKMIGTYSCQSELDGKRIIEKYSVKDIQIELEISTSLDSKDVTVDVIYGDVKDELFLDEKQSRKPNGDRFGIHNTAHVKQLADRFLVCPELYFERWMELQMLKSLQTIIFNLAG